jgi:hypothetical protein
MKITRTPITLDSGLYSAEWDAVRSPGLHLMHIVERMEEERNEILGIRGVNKNASPDELEAYRFGGFMYEHVVAEHIIATECERNPTGLMRPGEFFWCAQCDVSLGSLDPKRERCLSRGHKGIFATPDAVVIDTWRLKEWKFTWKSLRRAGGDDDVEYEHVRDGIWRWPVQTMAYCYLLDMTGADLEAFFVNGDYTDKRPKVMRYSMDFTKRDLQENWSAIVNTAKTEGWL